MRRRCEPELMLTESQAKAYSEADFGVPHSRYTKLFLERFPERPLWARVLDLGCGAADVTVRFARAHPWYRFDAVDGSPAMLKYARERVTAAGLAHRIRLVLGIIPDIRLPCEKYDVIISTSLLHHLHDPLTLWETIKKYGRPGTIVFMADLIRPRSVKQARQLVEKYSNSEPLVLKQDFFNSLCAAFTPAEVRKQLMVAGLHKLHIEVISDRHMIVHGYL